MKMVPISDLYARITLLFILPVIFISQQGNALGSFSFFSTFKKCPYVNDTRYREPLYVGVFLPSNYRKQIEPAIELALRHSHGMSNIIQDYCLNLVFKDTECKPSLGMKSLFDLMSSETKPVAVFGDVCTNVNEPVAMTSGHWDLLHLSYAETHSKFATADANELYPTFFRMVPGDRNAISAKCQMILHFNWTRVGTIKQSDDARYSLPHESLTTKLENNYGISVVYTAGLNLDELDKVSSELDELKTRDARVIIGDFDQTLGLKIICEAYTKGMYGSGYVWILQGYHNNTWWDVNQEDSNCTRSQILSVLEGHFSVEFARQRPDKKTKLVSGYTVKQVERELERVCKDNCQNEVYNMYAYDGIWTLVLALNKTLEADDATSSDFNRDHFLSAISSSKFEGLTGKVGFENHERLGIVNIYQFLNSNYQLFAHYDGNDNNLIVHNNTATGNWTPPQDATVVFRERQYVSMYLIIIMSAISLIGIIIALIFLAINIRYRNHRFIKMSSPNMNNLIIAGSICAYVSVILLGIDTRMVSPSHFVPFCHAKTWVLCIGFTLSFGSMFSKTWRVHSIFTNIQWNKKAIKDYKLLMLVALILAADIIILVTWAILSPFSFQVIDQPKIHANNKDIIPELEVCQSHNSLVFQLLLYGIKSLLMILGCFLAWETRHVNVPALNDSKYIGISVYNIVVMSVLGVSLAVLLKEEVDRAYGFSSFFIIFCTTVTLFLVFVPKAVELARQSKDHDNKAYRKGMLKFIVNRKSENMSMKPKSGSDSSETAKQKLDYIEKENLDLKKGLKDLSYELWALLDELKRNNYCDLHDELENRLEVIRTGEENEKNGECHKKSNNNTSNEESEESSEWKNGQIKMTKCSTENNKKSAMPYGLSKSRSKNEEDTSALLDESNISSAPNSPSNNGSVLVKRHSCESSWPWMDPSQHITML